MSINNSVIVSMWEVEVWGSIWSSLEGPSLIRFMISQELAGWCNKLLKVKILTQIKNGNQLLVVKDIIHALSSFHVLGRFPHLLNPAIPSVSGYLLQARIQLYAEDIGPNIPLWDLSLGKSDMKKEMLTRLWGKWCRNGHLSGATKACIWTWWDWQITRSIEIRGFLSLLTQLSKN